MKSIRTMSLFAAAACCLFAACSKSEAGAAETTKSATEAAAQALESVDLSKLTPEALAEKAKSIVADVSAQLGSLKDSQGAKDLVAKFQPLVDQLAAAKGTLATHKVDLSALKTALDGVATKFASNEEVMKVLQPLIDKLKSLAA